VENAFEKSGKYGRLGYYLGLGPKKKNAEPKRVANSRNSYARPKTWRGSKSVANRTNKYSRPSRNVSKARGTSGGVRGGWWASSSRYVRRKYRGRR